MPLTRITAVKGRSVQEKAKIKEVVLQTVVDKLHVPENDRFLIFEEQDADHFDFDPGIPEESRSMEFLLIQITLNVGRPVEVKKEFYAALAERLNRTCGVRKEDLFVNLIEVTRENWSYGGGIATFAL